MVKQSTFRIPGLNLKKYMDNSTYIYALLREFGLGRSAISDCLSGKRKSAAGFIWERAIREDGKTKYIPFV